MQPWSCLLCTIYYSEFQSDSHLIYCHASNGEWSNLCYMLLCCESCVMGGWVKFYRGTVMSSHGKQTRDKVSVTSKSLRDFSWWVMATTAAANSPMKHHFRHYSTSKFYCSLWNRGWGFQLFHFPFSVLLSWKAVFIPDPGLPACLELDSRSRECVSEFGFSKAWGRRKLLLYILFMG